MYHTTSDILLDTPSFLIQPYGDLILALDRKLGLHMLDTRRHFTLSGSISLLDLFQDEFLSLTLSPAQTALSCKGHLALCNYETHHCTIADFSSSIRRHTLLSWHSEPISCVAYHPAGKFFASADQDGTILLYDAENYHVLLTLPRLSAKIVAICFSESSDLIAYAGSSGELVVYDILAAEELFTATLSGTPRMMRFAQQDHYITILLEDGGLQQLHFPTETILPLSCDLPSLTGFARIEEEKQLLAYDETGKLCFLYDDKGGTQHITLDTGGISVLYAHKRFLVIANKDGSIQTIDQHKYSTEAKMNAEVQNYQKSREFHDKNCFLATSDVLQKEMQKGWEQMIEGALQHLIEGNVLRAHKLVAPFLDDEAKQTMFNVLKDGREHLEQFYKLVKKKEIEKAFQLVAQYPFLKKIKKYQDLEQYWNKAFLSAKKMLTANGDRHRGACEELLEPFRWNQEKRVLIENLLDNTDVFKRMDNAIRHENFKLFFSLADKNPFLQETLTYQKVLAYGNSTLQNALELEQNGDYTQALELLNSITDFFPFQQDLQWRIQQLESLCALQEAIEQSSHANALQMLVDHPMLRTSPISAKIKLKLERQFHKAFEGALRGEPEEAITALKPFLNQPPLAGKIASIMKIAYMNELLKQKKNLPNIHWKKSIKGYLERFGHDHFMERFTVHFKAEKLVRSLEHKADDQGYLTLPYVPTLIVSKTE